MWFMDWVKTADEDDLLEIVDNMGNVFFEDETWGYLDWNEIKYTKEEVRAWAIAYDRELNGEEEG